MITELLMRDPLLHRLFPELRLCRDVSERRAVIRETRQFRSWLYMAMGFMLGLATPGPALLILSAVRPYWMPQIAVVFASAMVGVIVFFLFTSAGLERRRREIREALCRRDVKVCVGCGYDLRGLGVAGSSTCPECGGE